MKRIFKYQLPREGETLLIKANIVKWLTVMEQDGWPHVWAIIDDEKPAKDYNITSHGTGWPLVADEETYIGTASDYLGYVWHYFITEVN